MIGQVFFFTLIHTVYICITRISNCFNDLQESHAYVIKTNNMLEILSVRELQRVLNTYIGYTEM